MTNDRGCLSFNWDTEVFGLIDKVYLTLCIIPLVSLVFVVWSLFSESFFMSNIIIYQHEKTLFAHGFITERHLWILLDMD